MSHRRAPASALLSALAIGLAGPHASHGQDAKPGVAPEAAEEASYAGISAPVGTQTPDALLLYSPSVRDELKLSPGQRKSLDRINRARDVRDAAFSQAVDDLSRADVQRGDAPGDRSEAFRDHQDQLEGDVDAAVARMLSPRQRLRLAQVRFQFDGPLSLSRGDVQARLNIDEDQAVLLREILIRVRDEMVAASKVRVDHVKTAGTEGSASTPRLAEPTQGRKAGLAQTLKANAAIRKAGMKDVARVLRKSQMENYHKLEGPPFDLDRLYRDEPAPTQDDKQVKDGVVRR